MNADPARSFTPGSQGTLVTLPVDVRNPGQFFACCGLLEVASRLYGGAEGWFGEKAEEFHVRLHAGLHSLEDIVLKLAAVPVKGAPSSEGALSEQEARRLRELRSRQKEAKRTGNADLSEEEKEQLRNLEERLRRSKKWLREGPVTFGDPLNLQVSWWLTHPGKRHSLKTFAGQQGALAIASKLHRKKILLTAARSGDPLGYCCLLEGAEPFYLDAGRYAPALDLGYSLDVQRGRARALVAPLTELLAFIGLQRFRPACVDRNGGVWQYFTWHVPLGPIVAAAVACGAVALVQRKGFRFQLVDRDSEGRYKAFGFATPV